MKLILKSEVDLIELVTTFCIHLLLKISENKSNFYQKIIF